MKHEILQVAREDCGTRIFHQGVKHNAGMYRRKIGIEEEEEVNGDGNLRLEDLVKEMKHQVDSISGKFWVSKDQWEKGMNTLRGLEERVAEIETNQAEIETNQERIMKMLEDRIASEM